MACSWSEAHDWREAGFEPDEASDSWSEAGFLPSEAHDWREAGFEPKEAADWREFGYALEDAVSWKGHDFDLAGAVQWSKVGIGPEMAAACYAAGMTLDEAQEWARAGFSAREAVEDEAPALTDYQLSWLEGLRLYVDLMERHPELIPTEGSGLDLVTSAAYGYGTWGNREGVAKICASWARALGHAEKDYGSLILSILAEPGRFGPHRVGTYASRAMVCEARVVEREVTAEIPDPELVAKLPMVTVTSVCKDVIYDCPPILAGAADKEAQ